MLPGIGLIQGHVLVADFMPTNGDPVEQRLDLW